MPVTVITAPPFILIKPKLTVGPAATAVQYECGANEIDASPEQDSTDTETFCGIFTSYKPAKWTVTVTCLQSYGTTGLWNALRPLVGSLQPFTVLPDTTKVVGPDNPEMQGTAYIPAFPFLSAPVGEASEFDFVLAAQGIPVFSTTPVLFEAEGATTESSPTEPAAEPAA